MDFDLCLLLPVSLSISRIGARKKGMGHLVGFILIPLLLLNPKIQSDHCPILVRKGKEEMSGFPMSFI